MTNALKALSEHGQSAWIDYLSRPFVRDGDLQGLIDEGIVGVTSNPTIFQGAIAEGDSYDDQLREVLRHRAGPQGGVPRARQGGHPRACDLLHGGVRAGRADPGRVGLAGGRSEPGQRLRRHDQEAERLHEMVERRNLFVKIPGTKAGLQAIEDTIAQGIPVNVTLLFSLQRHRDAAEAYVRGLRRLHEAAAI